MHLRFSTRVKASYLSVKGKFNEDLFLKLNPPFPPVKLKEFGGCKRGDKVHLQLNFIFFKQDWISEITFDNTDEKVFEFIDEGTCLPFFLKKWKHHHVVENSGNNESIIIDDITFNSPFIIMDFFLYPVLWLQFVYRKPIYKKFFNAG